MPLKGASSSNGTNGVAAGDGDSVAVPWVMRTTSLPLSGSHYPRLLRGHPPGGMGGGETVAEPRDRAGGTDETEGADGAGFPWVLITKRQPRSVDRDAAVVNDGCR